jgi:pimeloyl-ACP methyl ester carboxylesterase
MLNFPPTQHHTLPDNRHLAYAIYGSTTTPNPTPSASDLPTAFFFHGFPSSHSEAALLSPAASSHHIRLISVSRPGMSTSTFQPNRTLLDWPSDVLSLADALDVKKFAVIGLSGGGPYALACLHSLPRERCVGAGLIASLWPVTLGTRGMLPITRLALWAGPRLTTLLSLGLDIFSGYTARDIAHPERFEKDMDKAMATRPVADRVAFKENKGGLRDAMMRSSREALQEGSRGAAWDGRILGSEWGFGLGILRVQKGELVMWHGEEDVNVPVGMARKAKEMLPEGAERRIVEGVAHCSLVPAVTEEVIGVVERMLARARN